MSVPQYGIVVWQFAPLGDAWDGQYIYTDDNIGGDISDAYDFHQWAEDGEYTAECYLYKTGVANRSLMHRIVCKFSVSRLPDAGEYTAIISLGTNTFGSYYYNLPDLMIDSGGHLLLDAFGSAVSTATISVDTLYDATIYIDARDVDAAVLQLYIDGDLWVEEIESWWDWLPKKLYLSAGLDYYSDGYQAPDGGRVDVYTHIQDIVWTMEAPLGRGRWTMMAVL